jgi:hypothetical protein
MGLVTFDPPGFLDDFDDNQRRAWHNFISNNMDNAAAGHTERTNDSPRPQFFNPSKIEASADAVAEDVKWVAFPRIIQISSPADRARWRRADASRDVQDEYCEWSVKRDPVTQKITRVEFTCEGPEYWTFLAAVNPPKVLELYKAFVDSAVQFGDLFNASGRYEPRNRWNNSTSAGVMHLIQRNNTLGAEIEIAGAATIQRAKPDGTLITDTQGLILCGQYGAEQRNSDPFIGAKVNAHARNKSDVTLANPVGIYLAGLDTQGWSTPDNAPAIDFWKYVRGTPDRPVRAVLEVPAGKNYVLGDVSIDGRPIEFGAQVADRIQMTIRAVATRIGQSNAVPVRGCVGDGAGAGLGPQPVSVESALERAQSRGRI